MRTCEVFVNDVHHRAVDNAAPILGVTQAEIMHAGCRVVMEARVRPQNTLLCYLLLTKLAPYPLPPHLSFLAFHKEYDSEEYSIRAA